MRMRIFFLTSIIMLFALATSVKSPVLGSTSQSPQSHKHLGDDLIAPFSQAKVETSVALESANLDLIGQISGYSEFVTVQGNYAYVGEGTGLTVLNISNPTSPYVEKRLVFSLTSRVNNIVFSGSTALVADGSGLRMIDISDPTQPAEIGFLDTTGSALDIAISGNTAFVAASEDGLRMVDVSDPTQPAEIGFLDTLSYPSRIVVNGTIAFVMDDEGIQVLDISDPTQPTEIGLYNIGGNSSKVAVSGSTLFIAQSSELRIVDISNPTQPTEIGFLDSDISWIRGLAINDSTAFLTGSEGLLVIDISDPTQPTEIGFLDPDIGVAWEVAVSGNTAFVAAWDELHIIDISDPTQPTEIGAYTTPGDAFDVAISGNTAFVTDGFSMKIIDISDPTQPTEISSIETENAGYYIAISGSTAFVTSFDGGLHLLDISNLAEPTEIGSINLPAGNNTVAVSGSTVFVTNRDYGLHIVDISDPTQPTEIGFFNTTEYTYDVAVSGSNAFVGTYAGVHVIDISDPTQPTEIGFFDTTGHATDIAIRGSTALVANWSIGLVILDISDPTQPTEIGSFAIENVSSPQSIAFSGSMAIVSHYSFDPLQYQLLTLDISDPTQPVVTGSYRTLDPVHVVISDSTIFASGGGGLFILNYTSCPPNDTDCDGLLDEWETQGYDYDGDDIIDVNLPAMGADPLHKDIFVEIDYMVGVTHTHKPDPQAIQMIVNSFDTAPVDNPDGTTGIHLHVDYGADSPLTWGNQETWGALSKSQELPHLTYISSCPGGTTNFSWETGFDNMKNTIFDSQKAFTDARSAVFHYNIWAHYLCDGAGTTSGISRNFHEPAFGIGASDFIVSLGGWKDGNGDQDDQAGTFMHELGHNLGLRHGGADDVNWKPNYLSIMNYSFQTNGLFFNFSGGHFDYSRFNLFPLDENNLDESAGIGLSFLNTFPLYGTYRFCGLDDMRLDVLYTASIDWNCDNDTTDNQASYNINQGKYYSNNSDLTILTSQNDWDNLVFDGGAIGSPGALLAPESEVIDIDATQAAEIPPYPIYNFTFLPLVVR
ncbi:MAG: hypothetical protein CL608_29950 [Anaerolineaceae bacterium]|nr:hypothetical protein [Anaerolineaceae bacterium]